MIPGKQVCRGKYLHIGNKELAHDSSPEGKEGQKGNQNRNSSLALPGKKKLRGEGPE